MTHRQTGSTWLKNESGAGMASRPSVAAFDCRCIAAPNYSTEGSDMIRLARTRVTKGKNLAQQNTDFTSEGSPPPGKVDIAPPVTADKTTKAAVRAPATMPGAHKRAPAGPSR